jgi:hypothetical protein
LNVKRLGQGILSFIVVDLRQQIYPLQCVTALGAEYPPFDFQRVSSKSVIGFQGSRTRDRPGSSIDRLGPCWDKACLSFAIAPAGPDSAGQPVQKPLIGSL